MTTRASSLIILALALGCGSGKVACDMADVTALCVLPGMGKCEVYTGLSSGDAVSAQSFCVGNDGRFGDGECLSPNRHGVCKLPPGAQGAHIDCPGGASMTISYYEPVTQEQAQAECTAIAGATWTPD
jgi:hypothetical protein